MSDFSFSQTLDKTGVPGSSLLAELASTGQRFKWLYLLGLATLALSYPIAMVTGNRPDFATVGGFGAILLSLFVVLAMAIIMGKFVHMALVEKPQSPSKALIAWARTQLGKDQRLYNTAHMILSVGLFMTGFAVLKGAIAVLHPFSWDETFVAWDRAVHFGALPHEWLMPLIRNADVVSFFNFFYNIWYFVLLATLLVAGAAASRSPQHMRYMISFMLTWLIPGFFLALVFSSAGPCFYQRAGYGELYQPLMEALNTAAQTHQIWALPTQDLLWDGFVGARDGSAGISAFPSLHVATAVLIGCYARSFHKILALLAWGFAAIIMVGSVVLAWHYAVDGYAGAAMAVVIWKVTGRWIRPETEKS